jgi:hypothetical protein
MVFFMKCYTALMYKSINGKPHFSHLEVDSRMFRLSVSLRKQGNYREKQQFIDIDFKENARRPITEAYGQRLH